MDNILPDCRLKTAPAINRGILGTWEPVFCANCGADGGMCPAENMTFLFYLCNKCAEAHGHIAGTMLMPDEVFYQKLADEQIDKYNRYLTVDEWNKIAEDQSHPLWVLLKEQP